MAIEVVNVFDEYQQGALRTLNRKDFLQNVMHCAMGMVGESGELAEQPGDAFSARVGEVGDCMWYAAVLASEMGLRFSMVVENGRKAKPDYSEGGEDMAALLCAARLLDLVKKSWFYGKQLNHVAVIGHLSTYVGYLDSQAILCGTTLEKAGEINILKLYARYPDKFDAEKAINRDYAAESLAAGVKIE